MLKKIRHHWIVDRAGGQNSPIQPRIPKMPAAVLIGAPDDRGVLNVGGRLGAGHGPAAVRNMLGQYMLGLHGAIGRVEVHQGFDVDLGECIEAAHANVRRAVAVQLSAGVTPIVIGGGHDFGYPHAAGAFDALKGRIAVINIDPHLDVRPPVAEGITSGSPFYLALEDGVIKPENFVEFGIQEHCNDEMYYAYAKQKGVKIYLLDETRAKGSPAAMLEKLIQKFARAGLKSVVSFDVDSVQMAHAPGVSAPQADGFTPGEFLAMARVCGENPNVATVGFFELAPPLDVAQQTTRLVATAVHRFLSGLSERTGIKKILKKRIPVSRLLSR